MEIRSELKKLNKEGKGKTRKEKKGKGRVKEIGGRRKKLWVYI